MNNKMTDNSIQYSAKVLLFGEYTVLTGGIALAIPFSHFQSYWGLMDVNSPLSKAYWNLVEPLIELPLSKPLDVELLKTDRKKGIQLLSNIPFGSGLGSSGNLCAAIYHRYFEPNRKHNLETIKQDLIMMESYFHGKSSGMDPLCVFSDHVIRYQEGKISKVEKTINLEGLHFFLLDSKIPRKTKDLISRYKEKLSSKGFTQAIGEIEKRNNKCIHWLLREQPTLVRKHFSKLSNLQYEHWEFMIPNNIKESWEYGKSSGDYQLKVCGAGGGGYFLGLTSDRESIPENGILIDLQ